MCCRIEKTRPAGRLGLDDFIVRSNDQVFEPDRWTVLQVGVEAPVLTGVRSSDGSCLAVTVLSGSDYSGLDEQAHAQWDAVNCDAAADVPTLCRQGNPTQGMKANAHRLGGP